MHVSQFIAPICRMFPNIMLILKVEILWLILIKKVPFTWAANASKRFNEDPVLNGVLETISHRSAFGMKSDSDCDVEDLDLLQVAETETASTSISVAENSVLSDEHFSFDFLDVHQEKEVNLEEL
ncbi:hypothetical protein ABEB36_009485 [Hypothenemus hampei]|uniref:Uncharacterized protein n=1 Tax=Hypothenemus hampei TaxID=57062 RepID=A0ABD1EGR7_HYPHA